MQDRGGGGEEGFRTTAIHVPAPTPSPPPMLPPSPEEDFARMMAAVAADPEEWVTIHELRLGSLAVRMALATDWRRGPPPLPLPCASHPSFSPLTSGVRHAQRPRGSPAQGVPLRRLGRPRPQPVPSRSGAGGGGIRVVGRLTHCRGSRGQSWAHENDRFRVVRRCE